MIEFTCRHICDEPLETGRARKAGEKTTSPASTTRLRSGPRTTVEYRVDERVAHETSRRGQRDCHGNEPAVTVRQMSEEPSLIVTFGGATLTLARAAAAAAQDVKTV